LQQARNWWVHTDDDGEQEVAAVFHLEHNRVVRRRVPEPEHPRVVLHAPQVLAVAHLDDETAVRHAPELNCKQASTRIFFLSTKQTRNGRAVLLMLKTEKRRTPTGLHDAGVDELLAAGVEVRGGGAVAVGGGAAEGAASRPPSGPPVPVLLRRGEGEEPARHAGAGRRRMQQPGASGSSDAHAPEQLEVAADPRVGDGGRRRSARDGSRGVVAREHGAVDDVHRRRPSSPGPEFSFAREKESDH